jgi:hypothetical protein
MGVFLVVVRLESAAQENGRQSVLSAISRGLCYFGL